MAGGGSQLLHNTHRTRTATEERLVLLLLNYAIISRAYYNLCLNSHVCSLYICVLIFSFISLYYGYVYNMGGSL